MGTVCQRVQSVKHQPQSVGLTHKLAHTGTVYQCGQSVNHQPHRVGLTQELTGDETPRTANLMTTKRKVSSELIPVRLVYGQSIKYQIYRARYYLNANYTTTFLVFSILAG